MSYLDSANRRALERAVLTARDAAEAAARTALDALAVTANAPHSSMLPAERKLRIALRAQMRQLGPTPQVRENEPGFREWQEAAYTALIHACAYEQWHRMLFARFLAENSLLLHPEYGRITLDECVELAREQGIADPWDLAAEYAAGMLPGIFRSDDPLLRVKLAPEGRQALERILESIPKVVFKSDDGLGWVYQFWQAKKKDEVNKSERKIEGADIPAVTQLFTEPYMVRFLLQNTLGAWWLSLHPDSPLQAMMEYYKENIQHDFSAWPTELSELRIIDPCCGSGHFLVEALNMLLFMYGEWDATSTGEHAVAAIRDNLFGLEIDPRCTQIAAFAVALAAWKAGAPTDSLPVPNIACCGLPLRDDQEKWRRLANGDHNLGEALVTLRNLFANAGEIGSLGSLIDPVAETLVLPFADPNEVLRCLQVALGRERNASDPASAVFGETARGALRAFQILVGKHHLVVTNPPFLARGRQGQVIQDYCARRFPDAKKDLATCFIERCREFCVGGGAYAMVTPQNWLFLTSDKGLRKRLLTEQTWRFVIRLGAHAFDTIGGEVVQVSLLGFSNKSPVKAHQFLGIDASEPRTAEAKAAVLRDALVDETEEKKD